MSAVFLDASAFVKLVRAEQESGALTIELEQWPTVVSAELLRTEAVRACSRIGRRFVQRARELLDGIAMVPLDSTLLDEAASVGDSGLRTLDAIYLAAALRIAGEVGAFIAYDDRLAAAARAEQLPVLQPGR